MALLMVGLALVILTGKPPDLIAEEVEYPEPVGYVNDFAELLTEEEAQKLDGELRAFERKTSIEIAVVTVESLEGLTVEEYTLGLANTWGVGKGAKSNGVVLLVARKERRVRIEIGLGLEKAFSNSAAQRIIDDDILPHFRAREMSEGIIAGAQGIMGHLSGKGSFAGAIKGFFRKLKDYFMYAVVAVVVFVLRLFGVRLPGGIGGGGFGGGRFGGSGASGRW